MHMEDDMIYLELDPGKIRKKNVYRIVRLTFSDYIL